jgi:hypothetical protein
MAFNPLNPEWPKQATDAIDRVVQAVRRNVTNRAVKVTNAVVFGLLAAFAGLVALVLSLIVAVRAVESYLTWNPGTVAAWIVGIIALVGALVVIIGLVRSKKSWMLLGAVVGAFTGARWAIRAGDASIDHDTAVWIADLIVGGLFVVFGAFLMAKRQAPAES